MSGAIGGNSLLSRARVAGRCHRGDCSAVFHPCHFDDPFLCDLDRLSGEIPGPICDYLWFGRKRADNRQWVLAIEFKGCDFRASGVVSQLAGGAKLAEREAVIQGDACFCPVLVFGGGVHPLGLAGLRKLKVPFGGAGWHVQVVSAKTNTRKLSPSGEVRCAGNRRFGKHSV